MTRAQLLARVRRRVNEGTANRFADADIDVYLDAAWREIKEKITAVRPEEYVTTWRTSIVADQGEYARLVANERALRIKDTTSGDYIPIQPIDWVKLQAWDVGNALGDGEYRYAHRGQSYEIRPIPSTSIADGLEVEFLDLDSAIDTAGPTCPLSLHPLIVDRATMMAFDESGESGSESQGRAESEWSRADQRILFAYWDFQGEPFILSGVR